jgi:hypothetical protein
MSTQQLAKEPMKHEIAELELGQRGVAAERMRSLGWALVVASLAGCQPPASPSPPPALAEPAVFATWPRVTEAPVRVSPALAMLCSALPANAVRARGKAAEPNGPHAEYAIVVRVSPDGIGAYREGRPLPRGAVVVKEKYADASATGPMLAYALMTKRTAGFDPAGGDWEYAFVTRGAEPEVARGRLAGCAGCHASARSRDYLFRSYGASGR